MKFGFNRPAVSEEMIENVDIHTTHIHIHIGTTEAYPLAFGSGELITKLQSKIDEFCPNMFIIKTLRVREFEVGLVFFS